MDWELEIRNWKLNIGNGSLKGENNSIKKFQISKLKPACR